MAKVRRTPFDDYADEVRMHLSEPMRATFTTEDIRAARDSFIIAWPQPWRVAQRLEAKSGEGET